jgi:hypothetical protein
MNTKNKTKKVKNKMSEVKINKNKQDVLLRSKYADSWTKDHEDFFLAGTELIDYLKEMDIYSYWKKTFNKNGIIIDEGKAENKNVDQFREIYKEIAQFYNVDPEFGIECQGYMDGDGDFVINYIDLKEPSRKIDRMIEKDLEGGITLNTQAEKLEDPEIYTESCYRNVDEIKFSASLTLSRVEFETYYQDTQNNYLDELCEDVGEELEKRWGIDSIESQNPEWISKQEFTNSVTVSFNYFIQF